MPQELTNLTVREVSLVDRPACAETDPLTGERIPRARVALFKRDADQGDDAQFHKGENMLTLEQIEKKVTEQDALLAKMAADDAVTKAEMATLKSENEVLKMSAKQKKAFGNFSAKQKEDYMAADDSKKAAMMADACKGDDEPDGDEAKKRDDVLKASNDRIAKLEADRAADAARVAKAETELADIRKRERLAKFVGIAKAEIPNTTGSDVEKGQMLMDMADSLGGETSERYAKMLGSLKASDAALAAQFREIGKWGGGAAKPGAELEAKAQEIAKRDHITIEKAMDRAMTENPEIYKRYHEERYPVRH